MSNPVESDTCVPDTQETRYEGTNESLKVTSETQEASLNESQDFRLVDSEGDESMVEKLKQTQAGKANHDQADAQQIPETLQIEESNAITANDKEDESIIDEKVMESDARLERTTENVSSESEKKDELFDEDEIIQGTPPQSYSPFRKIGSVDVNLKRKASGFDEPSAKIPKMSEENEGKLQKRLEEESRQSCGSDDSYQDLFKNVDKNVIIEETQEPATVEFTQNTLKTLTEHAAETTYDDNIKEHHAEQTNQQDEKCDVGKDENLNVSAKLTDISNNDSTIVNFNSTSENDLLEENNVSIEKNVISTNAVIEKSEIETLDEPELVKDTETASDESNQSNYVKLIKKTVDENDKEIPSSQTKSRSSVELISIENRTVDSKSKPQIVEIDDDDEKILNSSTEVIYDRQSIKKKPEVVQIDDSHEDGEKILSLLEKKEIEVSEIQVMDKSYEGKSSYESKSSYEGKDIYENKSSYKESVNGSSQESKSSDKRLVNGSTESKKSDADTTVSLDSDTFSVSEEQLLHATTAAHNMKKVDGIKSISFEPKNVDNIELISISDHETSNVEEKNKSDMIYNNTLGKTKQEEREIGVYVKLKCLVHMDENTKELVRKELTVVQCEPVIESSRPKNEDSQSSLADISDNKESPGSVNSNPQLYQLFPSRWSMMSSSSSGSSAASLAFKMAKNTGHLFTMPTGLPKHTKKSSQDIPSTVADKQTLDETYDRLTHEWKNHRLLITTVLNYANMELSSNTSAVTAPTGILDTFVNVSNERLDDNHHHHLEKINMRSSTPSDHLTSLKVELTVTPKSTKKGSKAAKRPRSKLTRSITAQINGENGAQNIPNEPALHVSAMETDTPSKKKSKLEEDELVNDMSTQAKSPRSMLADELIDKNVFAKWSDNSYYLGTVSDRLKAKYKVNFYDGKSKTLIPEFVIPIPKILKKGLSVYATTKTDDYGSCGIIIDVETSINGDTHYTVETDEGEKLRVQIQNISLSADQAQVLKEEVDTINKSSLPSTPKALGGQVTLDNMIDGKRRSKRIGTPLSSTPKSRNNAGGSSTSTSKIKSEPSVSGMSAKLKKEKALSESEGMSSDSNVESTRGKTEDEYALMGIQKEIIGTPFEQIAKGPQSRNKSKSRSKKKEDPEMIATLGPIPMNSNIFKGTSFMLTCIPLEKLERYQDTKTNAGSNTETEATETDLETDYEDDWVKRHFVRERLHEQIIAGGGKIYEDFEKIPENEYENTILITNVPNTTAKNILCLSAGIKICNHEYIIRCCSEKRVINKAEVALPNGWSLQRKAYVEGHDAYTKKPLSEIVVIIPSLASINLPQFATFWRQVCEHAGAVVIIAENPDAMETDFADTVVVSNWKCPSWAQKKAIQLNIPILSTTWVVQCIIEGKLCPQNHPRYRYTCIPN
ncbi:TP53B protein, partial [Acromyrmex charruanus]